MELSEGNLYPSHSNEPLYARKTQQNINSLNTNNFPIQTKIQSAPKLYRCRLYCKQTKKLFEFYFGII